MGKLLSIVILFTILFAPQKVLANASASSAQLTKLPLPMEVDTSAVKERRTKILYQFLSYYDSPLAPYAQNFIDEAEKNNLDWKLLVAIAGVESYFGKMIPTNSHNAWGFGIYGNNVKRFHSWDEAIAVISQALRENYMNKWQAKNIYEIGRIYAADPLWANKVMHFSNKLDSFEQEYIHTTLSISL